MKLLCACFVVVLVTWMSFASSVGELKRGVLIMLEIHIVVSSLIFCLILILVFCLVLILVFHLVLTLELCLVLLLVLCLMSLMDLTIVHMVLVYERTTLSLNALDTDHVLIVVIVSRIGLVFLLEFLTLTVSSDICTVHIFPIAVHVPLGQVVRW
jgi:hypothetical protein